MRGWLRIGLAALGVALATAACGTPGKDTSSSSSATPPATSAAATSAAADTGAAGSDTSSAGTDAGSSAAATDATSTEATAPAVDTDITQLPKTTLSVWTSESGGRLTILQNLAKDFEKANPNISVKWVIRDFGAYPAQIKLALSSNKGPDVAIGNLGWSLDGPLIKAGLLRPLDDYAAAYGWDKRYPDIGLRQLKFSQDGKTYGVGSIYGTPYAADVIGWFYNVKMLAALGKEPPKTFADLEDILAASKAAGQQPIILGNKDGWPAWHVLFTIMDNLAAPEDVSGIVYGDDGATYLKPDVEASFQKLVDWKNAGYINKDFNALPPGDMVAKFAKGDALFMPAGSWNAGGLGDQMKDNVGFFLAPPKNAGDPLRTTGSFGYSFHIAANSKNVAAGAAFLDWMSNENAARAFFAAGDIAPLAVPGAQNKAGKIYADILTAWNTVLQNNGLLPYLDFATPTPAEIEYPTLQRILGGQTSVADGLKTIEDAREKFVKENAG